VKESTNTSVSYVWAERLLFLAILSLILLRSCNQQAQTTLTEQKFVKTRLNDSLTIYTQGQQITELKDLTEKLRIDKPKAAVEVVTRTVFKTKIALGDPIYIHDTVPALVLPREFQKFERWFSITGKINRLGYLQIDSLSIPATISVGIGDTLRGVFPFRKRESVVRVAIDNPNMVAEGLRSFVIEQPRKKWYETTAAKVGFGAVIGFGIARAQN
jgi:hypothetical protein